MSSLATFLFAEALPPTEATGQDPTRAGQRFQREITQLVTGLPGPEIGVDQIQVSQPDLAAAGPLFHCQVHGNLGFSASVISRDNNNVTQIYFHAWQSIT